MRIMIKMIENAPDISKSLVCACDVCHRLCSVLVQANSKSMHWCAPFLLHWINPSEVFMFYSVESRFSRATKQCAKKIQEIIQVSKVRIGAQKSLIKSPDVCQRWWHSTLPTAWNCAESFLMCQSSQIHTNLYKSFVF